MSRNQASYLKSHPFWSLVAFFLLLTTFSLAACSKQNKTHKTLNTPYFSMQHLSSWNVVQADYHHSLNGPIEENYVINMKVDYNPETNLNLNLFRETVESQNQITSLPGYISVSEKELNIQGLPALQRIIKTEVTLARQEKVNLVVILTYIVKDKIGVVLTAEAPENAFLAYNMIFNDMIQSFRFK